MILYCSVIVAIVLPDRQHNSLKKVFKEFDELGGVCKLFDMNFVMNIALMF